MVNFLKPLRQHKQGIPRDWTGDGASMDDIVAHVKKYVGDPETVIHEVASQFVHVDVHVVSPTRERPFYTLVTSGMSDQPMSVPEGAEDYRFAELMLCVPEGYPGLSAGEISSNEQWEVDGLRYLARMAHQYRTWLGWGHTIPNGDPPAVLGQNTQLCCFALFAPQLFDDGFRLLQCHNGKRIYLYAAVPIYREEMELKLASGALVLEELLQKHHVTELVVPRRANFAVMVQ